MAVYLISDTHFAHRNILRYRTEFSSIEDHDGTILDNILSVCGKKDTLYMLGDNVIYDDGLHYLRSIFQRVGFLHLCLGNHDLERKNSPTIEEYRMLSTSIFGMKKYKSAWLTHAPIHEDELRGKFNIHGHIHDREIFDRRYCNVSCEAIDYKPINAASVLEYLRESNE